MMVRRRMRMLVRMRRVRRRRVVVSPERRRGRDMVSVLVLGALRGRVV